MVTSRVVPVCVDLDGTLVKSDLLVESFFALVKKNMVAVLAAPLWLLRGKAAFKREIASRVELDVAVLPYEASLLGWLRQQRQAGTPLVLCTASDERIATAVNLHLGIFDSVMASDGVTNLDGARKRDALLARFGDRGFDYVGNAPVDLPIWRHARRAIVANAAAGVVAKATANGNVEAVFGSRSSAFAALLRAMRPHQWLKNLLVFVPLLAGHRAADMQLLVAAMLAFLAFGLCASSVYVLNDLLDLPSDRRHPSKRYRPFAAGEVPIVWGAVSVPLSFLASLAISLAALPLSFAGVLGAYFAVTLAYSVWLKQQALMDVLVLAGLYTARIIAGGAAVGIAPSFWLLAFSVFLFLSLAVVKRYAELSTMVRNGEARASGRGYFVSDLQLLQSLGVAAGYLSVLVLALYINSPESRNLYRHAELIWLLCPLLLFWVSRVWLKTHRGEMHEDPVVFALKDHPSRALAVLCALIVWAAS